MPSPHFNITITKRSKGKSAVAGAAYQSGSRIFSEYDQKYKDYTRKQGIIYTEVMLPEHAPPEYADRAILWNAVEETKNSGTHSLPGGSSSRFPREVPPEYYLPMVKDYCNEFFVSKGMCCDFAIHDPDPPGHNPHCHVMLTMRALDENGRWLPKARKVYDLDENGERIRLPSGNWKCHKENTADWNERFHGEEWRHGWEVTQNRYLELAGSDVRVDLRSYERQGLDVIPTVHMGPAVTQMERPGNRNEHRQPQQGHPCRQPSACRHPQHHQRLAGMDCGNPAGAGKKLLPKRKRHATPALAGLLTAYMDLRKAERRDWSGYGKQKGATEDLKAVSKAMMYLNSKGLVTLEDLDRALQGLMKRRSPSAQR